MFSRGGLNEESEAWGVEKWQNLVRRCNRECTLWKSFCLLLETHFPLAMVVGLCPLTGDSAHGALDSSLGASMLGSFSL
jgi:hypothetical protein